MYQSIDWGGSSFEGEVLTVSTQPGYHGLAFALTCICDLGKLRRDVPGIGSFPCRFKKAEYATINLCAYSQENDVLASWTSSCPSSVLGCNPKASIEMPVGVFVPPPCLNPLILLEGGGTHIDITDTDTPRHSCGVDESQRRWW